MKSKRIRSSISYKVVLMFVLLTISIIIVIGTFMINRIDNFYHEEFESLMNNVFSEEYVGRLNKNLEDGNVEQVMTSINTYSGQMGIDSYRNYYILDGKSGNAITGTNPELAKTLDMSPNIISALNGKIGDRTEASMGYMDFAVPLKNGNNIEYIVYVKDSKEEVNSIVQNILSIIFSSLLFGIFISVAFGILLSKTIISPISSLTQKARRISSGDFGNTIDVKASDEIGQLTNTFNDMSMELHKTLKEKQSEIDKTETILQHMADGVIAFDTDGKIMHINPAAKKLMRIPKIENSNFDLIFSEIDLTMSQVNVAEKNLEKVIKRNESEIKLFFAKIKTRDKMGGIVVVLQDITEQQKLDNSRREFVANVSHELRTPITTVKGYAETLLDSVKENDYDKDMFETFLTVINNESDRMTRLVKDLLLLSKLDYSKKGLKREEFDLASLIEGVVSRFQITAKNAKVNLYYEPIGTLPIFTGDRDSIEQVIVNLVSNAVKYTSANGKVIVSVGKLKGNVYIKIKDNGIGIPREDLPHIFERFYRVDKARSRERGGTGLGLAISKDIIVAHGGDITISSDYGIGTEVIITLPIKKPIF
ncbi:MAG: cell wall metabolism sensor histidine kinase WalK [Ruminococcaceae bacterium]|nr:cell wall metabolism sensor histidine kinase WalK [Oscillospiraceae bacterium]